MKKMFLSIMLTFTIITSLYTVNAAYIEDLKMDIQFPVNYVVITKDVTNSDEELASISLTRDIVKEYFDLNNIVVDAISKYKENEIIVTSVSEDQDKAIQNLSLMPNKELEEFANTYKEAKLEEVYEPLKNRIYKKNGITYINNVVKINWSEDRYTVINEYFTIVDGKAITISMNSTNKEINEDEFQNTIDTIKFKGILNDYLTSGNKYVDYKSMALIAIIVLIIAIIVGWKIYKNNTKKVVDEKEKYNKLGGLLLAFLISLVIILIFQIFNMNILEEQFETFKNSELLNNYIVITSVIQSILILVFPIITVFLLSKRNEKTPKKIRIFMKVVFLAVLILILIRLFLSYKVYGFSIYNRYYYINQIVDILYNLIYVIVWNEYLKKSKRVKEYYKE